jgi:hypothetical protein
MEVKINHLIEKVRVEVPAELLHATQTRRPFKSLINPSFSKPFNNISNVSKSNKLKSR